MMKDDLKLAIQKALKDEDMQKSIQKMHNLFTGTLSILWPLHSIGHISERSF